MASNKSIDCTGETTMDCNSTLFSIVVPVYGNEKNIPVSVPYMLERKDMFPGYKTEFIFVCDGSPDNSYAELKKMKQRYPNDITIVNFTRNFNQGAAVHCGIDLAKGEVIGVISCDMQDPFELFCELLAAWEEGYKLAIASRSKRNDKGLGVLGSKAYHRLVHRYISKSWPVGGFDFFLMDRKVADQYSVYDVANGSMQMLILWFGYRTKVIEYTRAERQIGKSGYNFIKKLNLVMGIFTTYSPIVSRVWVKVGIALIVLSLLVFLISLVSTITNGGAVSTLFALLSSLMLLCTGIILVAISALGEYIWRDYRNSLSLPRYVIDEIE